MNELSAIIVAKDNPPHLNQTLASIEGLASEVIILDIGLADSVKNSLMNRPYTKVVPITKPVPYVELIREESKKYAQFPYILFLDPDEIVIPTLKEQIKKNYQSYDYLKIPRKNLIFGRWIEHSRWWPDYQVRVFHKDKVHWPTTIHSQPEVKGNGMTIETKEELALLHYNYENVDEFLQKLTRYSKAEATHAIESKQNVTVHMTIKRSLSEFISRYFAQRGYKDGSHGFVLAFLQMISCWYTYFYFWEMKKYTDTETSKLPQASLIYFQHGFQETSHWLIKEGLVNSTKSLIYRAINTFMKRL